MKRKHHGTRIHFKPDTLLFQIDCVAENELTARINMADAKFSFQEKGKYKL